MTEESTEPGNLIIACLCLVCVYFSLYKYDSCFVKISFTATVKEESLTQPPLLLCNLSKSREETFIWVKFLCKAPCEGTYWGCAARAGGCAESQVSVSPEVWFNFLTNDLGDGAGTILTQWATARHQGGAAVTLEGWLGIQSSQDLIKSERDSGKKKEKKKNTENILLEASTASQCEISSGNPDGEWTAM